MIIREFIAGRSRRFCCVLPWHYPNSELTASGLALQVCCIARIFRSVSMPPVGTLSRPGRGTARVGCSRFALQHLYRRVHSTEWCHHVCVGLSK